MVEELRRCKEFSVWQSEEWLRKRGARPDTDPELREGLDAYAYLQAEYRFQYAQQVDQRWAKLREHAQQVIDRLPNLALLTFELDDGDDGEDHPESEYE